MHTDTSIQKLYYYLIIKLRPFISEMSSKQLPHISSPFSTIIKGERHHQRAKPSNNRGEIQM